MTTLKIVRKSWLIVVATVASLAWASPVSAHGQLDSSSPAPAAVLETAPSEISLDFNEPVITNTVFHTLGRNFLEVVNTEVVPGVAIQWNIFPNPVADQLQLQLSGEDVPERLLLQVLDAQGRLLRQASFSGKNHSLSVADLPAGWYQLSLTLPNGDPLGTARLIKK